MKIDMSFLLPCISFSVDGTDFWTELDIRIFQTSFISSSHLLSEKALPLLPSIVSTIIFDDILSGGSHPTWPNHLTYSF